MEAKVIKSVEEYETSCNRLYDLINRDLPENSTEADELELLAILVEDYEEQNFPVPPPHPIEAIKFKLDQMGLDDGELSKILGNRQRKSDILKGKRKLSLSMIRKLSHKLRISADTLIQEY